MDNNFLTYSEEEEQEKENSPNLLTYSPNLQDEGVDEEQEERDFENFDNKTKLASALGSQDSSVDSASRSYQDRMRQGVSGGYEQIRQENADIFENHRRNFQKNYQEQVLNSKASPGMKRLLLAVDPYKGSWGNVHPAVLVMQKTYAEKQAREAQEAQAQRQAEIEKQLVENRGKDFDEYIDRLRPKEREKRIPIDWEGKEEQYQILQAGAAKIKRIIGQRAEESGADNRTKLGAGLQALQDGLEFFYQGLTEGWRQGWAFTYGSAETKLDPLDATATILINAITPGTGLDNFIKDIQTSSPEVARQKMKVLENWAYATTDYDKAMEMMDRIKNGNSDSMERDIWGAADIFLPVIAPLYRMVKASKVAKGMAKEARYFEVLQRREARNTARAAAKAAEEAVKDSDEAIDMLRGSAREIGEDGKFVSKEGSEYAKNVDQRHQVYETGGIKVDAQEMNWQAYSEPMPKTKEDLVRKVNDMPTAEELREARMDQISTLSKRRKMLDELWNELNDQEVVLRTLYETQRGELFSSFDAGIRAARRGKTYSIINGKADKTYTKIIKENPHNPMLAINEDFNKALRELDENFLKDLERIRKRKKQLEIAKAKNTRKMRAIQKRAGSGNPNMDDLRHVQENRAPNLNQKPKDFSSDTINPKGVSDDTVTFIVPDGKAFFKVHMNNVDDVVHLQETIDPHIASENLYGKQRKFSYETSYRAGESPSPTPKQTEGMVSPDREAKKAAGNVQFKDEPLEVSIKADEKLVETAAKEVHSIDNLQGPMKDARNETIKGLQSVEEAEELAVKNLYSDEHFKNVGIIPGSHVHSLEGEILKQTSFLGKMVNGGLKFWNNVDDMLIEARNSISHLHVDPKDMFIMRWDDATGTLKQVTLEQARKEGGKFAFGFSEYQRLNFGMFEKVQKEGFITSKVGRWLQGLFPESFAANYIMGATEMVTKRIGRAMFSVADSRHATYERLFNQHAKNFKDAIKNCSVYERGIVTDFINESASLIKENPHIFSTEEYIKRGFTEPVRRALDEWKKFSRVDLRFKNYRAQQDLIKKGWGVLGNADGSTTLFVKKAKDIKHQDGVVKVFNPDTGAIEKISLQEAEALKKEDGLYRSMVNIPSSTGDETVRYVKSSKDHFYRGISYNDQVINDIGEGYFALWYENGSVFMRETVMEGGKNITKTIGVFSNTKSAQQKVKELTSQGRKVWIDRDQNFLRDMFNEGHSNLWRSEVRNRVRTQLLHDSASGQFFSDYKDVVRSPIDFVDKRLRQMAEMQANQGFIEGQKKLFEYNWGDLLPNGKWTDDIKEIFPRRGSGIDAVPRTEDARLAWNVIAKQMGGVGDMAMLDRTTKGLFSMTADKLARMSVNTRSKVLADIFGMGEEMAIKLSDVQFGNLIRNYAHHTLITFNPLKQWLLQPAQALTTLVRYPLRWSSGQVFSLLGQERLYYASKGTSKKVSPLFKDIIEGFQSSGMRQGIMAGEHQLAQGVNISLGGKVTENFYKYGFAVGENLNNKIHYFATALDYAKKNGLQRLSKYDLDVISGQARALALGANSAGSLRFSKGLMGAIFQFATVPFRAWVSVLGGKVLSPTDKMALAAQQLMLWGTISQAFTPYITDVMGVKDPEAVELIQQGIFGTLMNQMFVKMSGDDTAKLDFNQTFGAMNIDGLVDTVKVLTGVSADSYEGQGVLAAIARSPSIKQLGKVSTLVENAYDFVRTDQEETPHSMMTLANDLANLTSGSSNLFKGFVAWNYGRWLGNKGRYGSGSINTTTIVGRIMGVPAKDAETFLSREFQYDVKDGRSKHLKLGKEYIDKLVQNFRLQKDDGTIDSLLRKVDAGLQGSFEDYPDLAVELRRYAVKRYFEKNPNEMNGEGWTKIITRSMSLEDYQRAKSRIAADPSIPQEEKDRMIHYLDTVIGNKSDYQ